MEKKKSEVKPTEQTPNPKPLNEDQLSSVTGGLHDVYTQIGKLPTSRTQFVE